MQTEDAIVRVMQRLMEGRTTFIIAHRLSTLTHCDARLVIEHGQLPTVIAERSVTTERAA